MDQKIENVKKIINTCLYQGRCSSCEMVDERAVLTCRKTLELVLELLEQTVECDRCAWKDNGGCSEWNG